MVKNFFLVIFISILILGCDNQISAPELEYEDEFIEENEESYYLDISSYLNMDEMVTILWNF